MTKKYIVYGRVQRVGFRYFIYKLSTKLKFNGSVRNLIDGSVEIVIESDKHKAILKEIKNGNFLSHIEKIIEIEEVNTVYNDFKILD